MDRDPFGPRDAFKSEAKEAVVVPVIPVIVVVEWIEDHIPNVMVMAIVVPIEIEGPSALITRSAGYKGHPREREHEQPNFCLPPHGSVSPAILTNYEPHVQDACSTAIVDRSQ